MDPQQRLLLETSWEALERAGHRPASLRGTPTGVFVGHQRPGLRRRCCRRCRERLEGYLRHRQRGERAVRPGGLHVRAGGPGGDGGHGVLVVAGGAAPGRAGAAAGECRLALAGGVTVMATPGTFVEFRRQRRAGRRRPVQGVRGGAPTAPAGARASACCVVERLSDARRNGHPVLAVVRGSAVNQDGASNGLTAPNGPSQQRVIRQALAERAVCRPSDVDVVEAHGTGTTLGDPIEAQALLATYGQDRPERPLWLGSVKSNIGHTQAAAGVGGCDQDGAGDAARRAAATLHVDEPSPHVDWAAGAVRLLTEARPWPDGGPAPPGRCLLVRHQRHQRARHPRTAPRAGPHRPVPTQRSRRARARGAGAAVRGPTRTALRAQAAAAARSSSARSPIRAGGRRLVVGAGPRRAGAPGRRARRDDRDDCCVGLRGVAGGAAAVSGW